MRIRKPRTDKKVEKRRKAINNAFSGAARAKPVSKAKVKALFRAEEEGTVRPAAKVVRQAKPVLYEAQPAPVPKRSLATGKTSTEDAFAERKRPLGSTIRLNKFIAMSGKCSRRDADDLITSGKVMINGRKVVEPGTQVMPNDEIVIDGELLAPEPMAYVLLHKPKNTITTVSDEQGRPTATDILKGSIPLRLFPVGRLDRNTSGLLLFTNDGELSNRLLHPKYRVEKVYKFDVEQALTADQIELLKKGVKLEDGLAKAYFVQPMDDTNRSFKIGVTEGRNHLIRRMIESLGVKLLRLKRTDFANMKLGNLLPGEWRYLTEAEVNKLRAQVELAPVKMKA